VPYVGANGRKPHGKPRERHDDLSLICRDEETVERFIRYANAEVEPTGVDALLAKVENAKQVNEGQWQARCPAHDDRVSSLAIAQGDKGAIVHCHAGLDITALFDREDAPPLKKRAAAEPDPLPTLDHLAIWQTNLSDHARLLDRIYELRKWSRDTLIDLGVGFDGQRLTLPVHGRDGELLNLLRYLPRRTANEPKLLALKGRPRDIFPALRPTLSDNGNIETEVWLVEGEPDAISGRELGLPTFALPGSNGWRSEWAHRFAGLWVVVCFDCDDAGRKASERVCGDLSSVADVVALDLEPGRNDGYDLSDALLEGADAPILRAMAESAMVAV
jgi:hypothetical protein